MTVTAVLQSAIVACVALAPDSMPLAGYWLFPGSLTWHPEVPGRSRAPMDRAVCFPRR
jgi:hypothetical protein